MMWARRCDVACAYNIVKRTWGAYLSHAPESAKQVQVIRFVILRATLS